MRQIEFIKDLIKQLCEACEETGIVKGQMSVVQKELRDLQARQTYTAVQTAVQINGKVPGEAVRQLLELTSTHRADNNKRIDLIKKTRDLTGLGLKESKDLVDAFYPPPYKRD